MPSFLEETGFAMPSVLAPGGILGCPGDLAITPKESLTLFVWAHCLMVDDEPTILCSQGFHSVTRVGSDPTRLEFIFDFDWLDKISYNPTWNIGNHDGFKEVYELRTSTSFVYETNSGSDPSDIFGVSVSGCIGCCEDDQSYSSTSEGGGNCAPCGPCLNYFPCSLCVVLPSLSNGTDCDEADTYPRETQLDVLVDAVLCHMTGEGPPLCGPRGMIFDLTWINDFVPVWRLHVTVGASVQTAVYELVASAWDCHGDNIMTKIGETAQGSVCVMPDTVIVGPCGGSSSS